MKNSPQPKENSPPNIDAYIANFPADTQALLTQLRAAIRETAPDATETINYGIPTFQMKGNLVHFGAYKKHIGFYPGAAAVATFREELLGYLTSKGTIHFPLDTPLPLELIETIVLFRVEQQLTKRK